MAEFYNPYHFVPVTSGPSTDDLPVMEFRAGNTGHVRHDLYASDAGDVFSGRLVCRLTTEGPTVVGGQHERPDPEGPTVVHPFELEGKPAIPATSLKGLISSIAEAASNSALRVLENKVLSHRVGAGEEPLSAIGMVVEAPTSDGTVEWRLRPLALPTMRLEKGRAQLPSKYQKMFPADRNPPPLKVFVNDDVHLRTFIPGAPEYYYSRLSPRSWSAGHSLAADEHQHLSHNGGYLLAQDTIGGSAPIPERQLPVTDDERRQYTRGILRILGVQGRTDIPTTKKHELFLPYSEADEKRETFPIPRDVLDRFHLLADERTNARDEAPFLPYETRGTLRNLRPNRHSDHTFRLKTGDLVYFRPNEKGDAVEEIALSSMWRRWAGTVNQYFSRISDEKLPLGSVRRERISIAEQLFGFIEKREADAQDEQGDSVLALAGRLRFSPGILSPGQDAPYYGDATLLKILGSPKPPQPAFYFKYDGGRTSRIQVGSLSADRHYLPQGRKFYLHRSPQDNEPWKTRHERDELKQKSRVTPMKTGLSFYFHIDFNNLSRTELGLLCYALRPTEAYRHKLGMGKPIGLGQVRIDPAGLFLIDRPRRYRETDLFSAVRYHHIWTRSGEQVNGWPDTYQKERHEAARPQIKPGEYSPDDFRSGFSLSMNGDLKQALEILGDPAKIRRHPVHTPQIDNMDLEEKTYRWFVDNQNTRNRQQRLEPLGANSQGISPLEDTWKTD